MYYRQTAGLLSGCLLLFPRKLMWTDSTVIRFFILLVYYLFHFSLAEWIQLTGKHMADEDWAKVIFMKSICAVRKKKTIIKQRKNVFNTSVRHIKMDCRLSRF